MSKKNDNKAGLIDLLAQKTILPSDELIGKFRLEIRGRKSAAVFGCHRILKYEPKQIVVLAKDFSVALVGEGLICTAYHEGAICIEGYITGVKFDADIADGGES